MLYGFTVKIKMLTFFKWHYLIPFDYKRHPNALLTIVINISIESLIEVLFAFSTISKHFKNFQKIFLLFSRNSFEGSCLIFTAKYFWCVHLRLLFFRRITSVIDAKVSRKSLVRWNAFVFQEKEEKKNFSRLCILI